MAIGAFLEPLAVVSLLFGGAFFNRNKNYDFWEGKLQWISDKRHKKSDDSEGNRSSSSDSWSSISTTRTLAAYGQPTLRRRKLQLFGYNRTVTTPNTHVFQDRFLSRVLQKFPFLAEALYWALIYWVRIDGVGDDTSHQRQYVFGSEKAEADRHFRCTRLVELSQP